MLTNEAAVAGRDGCPGGLFRVPYDKSGETIADTARTHADERTPMNIHTSAGFEAPNPGRF
jgi:hypothetical protein